VSNSDHIVQSLRKILGEKGVREEANELLPSIILKPESTEQVSAILAFCHEANQAIIPIGGKSGLAQGIHKTGDELGLSMERMTSIEEVDVHNRTMTVQAGCILQVAAEAGEEKGLLLPLDLGARGSATIGGTVATNAGGNRVIRYGMMRDMVLGLEVVLADGTIVTSMNKLIKNNTGYDLKQMFIGAEGTLGVITRVVIRLRPLPKSQNTALLAVPNIPTLINLLHFLDSSAGGTLSAFEVMWPEFYQHITREGSNHNPPLPYGSEYYVLVETLGSEADTDGASFEAMLGRAMEEELIENAVLAKSQSERNAIWEIRDDVLELFNLGPLIPFDISVALDHMEDFVDDVQSEMKAIEEPLCFIFGHLGDCNLHVILGTKKAEAFNPQQLEELLYRIVDRYEGSVSAEHGIGLTKRDHLHCSRNKEELALMCRLKHMMDPKNILNPNKVLAADFVSASI
jgi:FAD/FMN-containing dehydrogenase